MQPDQFNTQVRTADERVAGAVDSPATSSLVDNMRSPTAFANSPASSPIKIPARRPRRLSRNEIPDELQEPDSSPTSTTGLLGEQDSAERSAKRTRIGYGTRDETEADSSPTPAGPRVSIDSTATRMTIIGAGRLAKLREDKEKLLDANKGLAKEAARLKKKATKDEKRSAEVDVLTMENQRLERAIEKENQENVELQTQLSQLRALHQALQQDHQRVSSAYYALNSRALSGRATAAAPGSPEPNSSPGIDLARGFERYGRSGEERK